MFFAGIAQAEGFRAPERTAKTESNVSPWRNRNHLFSTGDAFNDFVQRIHVFQNSVKVAGRGGPGCILAMGLVVSALFNWLRHFSILVGKHT